MTLRKLLPRALPLAPLLLATAAQAHPGHPHPFDEVDEFDLPDAAQAFLHPFTGLDHLVAALAVGCLAYMMGRRLGAMVSALFMGTLVLGWAGGRVGLALPMLEQGLALSVVVAGVMLAMHGKFSNTLRFSVIAAMGFWHGSAHGMEMASASPALGLMLGTGMIVALGTISTALLSKLTPATSRYAGAAAVATGVVLIAQRLG